MKVISKVVLWILIVIFLIYFCYSVRTRTSIRFIIMIIIGGLVAIYQKGKNDGK